MRAHSCCASSRRLSRNFSRVSIVPRILLQTSLDACILRAILCVQLCGPLELDQSPITPVGASAEHWTNRRSGDRNACERESRHAYVPVRTFGDATRQPGAHMSMKL